MLHRKNEVINDENIGVNGVETKKNYNFVCVKVFKLKMSDRYGYETNQEVL